MALLCRAAVLSAGCAPRTSLRFNSPAQPASNVRRRGLRRLLGPHTLQTAKLLVDCRRIQRVATGRRSHQARLPRLLRRHLPKSRSTFSARTSRHRRRVRTHDLEYIVAGAALPLIVRRSKHGIEREDWILSASSIRTGSTVREQDISFPFCKACMMYYNKGPSRRG